MISRCQLSFLYAMTFRYMPAIAAIAAIIAFMPLISSIFIFIDTPAIFDTLMPSIFHAFADYFRFSSPLR
jgi:hypothetical protein